MKKVCLIDGSGYIFRAFYALPTMTAPNGVPVNAVYGFMTMFMRLVKTIECDYCVVLFDAKRQNFRNEIFAEYKATRDETPELLVPQFDLIHQAVEVMNFPWVMQEGYEADDLIATYAEKALKNGNEVVIVSADKDLMQLIKPGITFYDGMKDKFFTPEDVKEKFGVYPDKVVDVQALSGDKIDNIPGVPGIGPKTAAELVSQFGSLQGVLANADEIKQQKRREMIKEHAKDAEISLQLVTLNKNVPVAKDLEEFKCCAPKVDVLLEFAQNLGFKSILPKLEKWAKERCGELGEVVEVTNEPKKLKYIKISQKKELEDLYMEIMTSQKVGLQILHNGREPVAISFSANENSAYYLPLPQVIGADLFAFEKKEQLENAVVQKFLLSVLENQNILKIGADLKTQWHWLNKICDKELNLFPYDDVAIMSYVLDSSEHEHTLGVMCEHFLDERIATPKASGKNKELDFEAEELGNYIFEVADYTLQLHRVLKTLLFEERKDFVYEMLDRRLVQVLLKMETAGITVNDLCMAELDKEFAEQMQKIEKEIFELAGVEFNLSSPKQIGEVLFEKMGIKARKNASGSYNTSAEVLEQLAEEYDIAAKILEWRSYAKLKSTYTTALLEVKDSNNRVHTTFSQTVVNTGRLASSNPNLQNIPNRSDIGRKIRECFVAKKGYKIVAADYSQMELRLLATVANVKSLKEAFANNVDIHTATAARVFDLPYDKVDREHRSRAKAINFGIVYGISQFGLAKQIGVSKEQAKKYIDAYFQMMPEVKEYMDKTIDFAHKNGFVLTPMGRKCSVMGINDKNHRLVSFAERAAINAPIQGGAADIVKIAMQKVNQMLEEQKINGQMLLQVHDELVLEVKADEAEKTAQLLKQIMENAADTDVKMEVEVGIGDNWFAAH